jgi:hypothetical protein
MRFVKRSMNPPIRVYLEHIDRGVCVSEVGLTKHIVTGFQKIHVRWGLYRRNHALEQSELVNHTSIEVGSFFIRADDS